MCDDAVRFALLTRAAIECCQRMGFGPDVFHANDWHTALLPLYLEDPLPVGRAVRAVEDGADDPQHRLPGRLSVVDRAGSWAGRAHREAPPGGSGRRHGELPQDRDPLRRRGDDRQPDPRRGDPHAGVRHGPRRPAARAVEQRVGHPQRHRPRGVEPADRSADPVPVLGRRPGGQGVLQAGPDARPGARPRPAWRRPSASSPGWCSRRASTCCARCCRASSRTSTAGWWCWAAARRPTRSSSPRSSGGFPGRVCFYRGYNNELAHRIEAGCDLFLMPSLYEPCGLNQMYSLAYGTPPIVRKTGGLADAVQLFDLRHRRGQRLCLRPRLGRRPRLGARLRHAYLARPARLGPRGAERHATRLLLGAAGGAVRRALPAALGG